MTTQPCTASETSGLFQHLHIVGVPQHATGTPRSLETPPSGDPTVGLYLGFYGGPRGGALSCERGTPVYLAYPRTLHNANTRQIPKLGSPPVAYAFRVIRDCGRNPPHALLETTQGSILKPVSAYKTHVTSPFQTLIDSGLVGW